VLFCSSATHGPARSARRPGLGGRTTSGGRLQDVQVPVLDREAGACLPVDGPRLAVLEGDEIARRRKDESQPGRGPARFRPLAAERDTAPSPGPEGDQRRRALRTPHRTVPPIARLYEVTPDPLDVPRGRPPGGGGSVRRGRDRGRTPRLSFLDQDAARHGTDRPLAVDPGRAQKLGLPSDSRSAPDPGVAAT